MCRKKDCGKAIKHNHLDGYCSKCYSGKLYTNRRRAILAETIEEWRGRLSGEELMALLTTGYSIYQQGVGLTFSEVADMITEEYK